MVEASYLLQQNRMLHEEIKRRIDQISAINTVAATVGHSLDLNITLDTALQAVVSVLGAEAAGISLIDEEAREVVLRAQFGWMNDFVVSNPMRIPLGRGMSWQVINNDDVVVHNNLTGQEEYAVPSFRDEAFRSIAMAPMHARSKVIGILSIMSHSANRFDEASVNVLRSIADTVGIAIDNARMHEQHVEQENWLAAILHSSADGIIATDQNSRITLVNEAAARMLDVEPHALMGVPLREAHIQVRVQEKLLQALVSDEPAPYSSFRVMLETGRELWVIISQVRIPQQVEMRHKPRDGWVILLQDISHVRASEVARVQFIQAAAHDMKNPLSVAQSSIHMLHGMLSQTDESVTEVLNIAGDSISRVQRLIDDMLHIEKIEAGYGFALEEVDLREMCYEVIAQATPLLQNAKIEHQMQIAADVPLVVVLDREWMTRALLNYLENAAKYASSSQVEFRVFARDGWLHFEVQDGGPGIPAMALSRVFERFFRLDDRKEVRGSGLGLAIVRSVAEAHHGQPYVQSEEGQGATFGIMIPLKQDVIARDSA